MSSSEDTNTVIHRKRGSVKNVQPAAESSSTSSIPTATASSKKLSGHGIGFTEDGTPFEVPETLNTMEIFLPQNIFAPGPLISASCILFTAYTVLFCGWSKWFHIGVFFFFRLSYDLGLGLILRGQSEHKTFLKFYLKLYGDGTTSTSRLLDWLAESQLSRAVRAKTPITTYPHVFRAWLVYKNLVNIILVNDGLSYLFLGLKCFTFPPSEGFTFWVIMQYLLGICLALFNWWAKVDAHRCIGEYCWYWGDFFYRKDLNLTFDGIFELFPHPMYTVGYSLYYGYSLIARSYTMLFVSLVAHGLQLAFLFFVEEPHIKRTYGSPPALDKSKSRILYDPKSGLFPDKNDNVFLANFDLFRSGDFATLLFCIYGLGIAILPLDPVWAFAQVIMWRAIHWIGLGAILWGQSNFQLWTRHFTTRGRTLHEAFSHWKNTYNLSLTMNIVVFVACALRYANLSFNLASIFAGLTGYNVACFALGGVLVSLSVWSYTSTYEAVGEFGWFYGDFFISEENSNFKQQLCYTGIYRFLNNPDCVTGYAGQYGLALMAQSWPIFFLALGSHVLNVLFLNLVEIPHMNKLYNTNVRKEAPFPKAIKRIQKTVLPSGLPIPSTIKNAQTQLERNFKGEVKKIRTKAMEEVYDIYKKLSDSRKAVQEAKKSPTTTPGGSSTPSSPTRPSKKGKDVPAAASSSASPTGVTITTPERVSLGESLVVQYTASVVPREQSDDSSRPKAAILSNSKSSYDWVGVYPVDVSSAPGASNGNWVYVEPSANGTVVFPSTLLPSHEGVYEVRYHRNNSYVAVASHPFILADEHSTETETPLPSSSPALESDPEVEAETESEGQDE